LSSAKSTLNKKEVYLNYAPSIDTLAIFKLIRAMSTYNWLVTGASSGLGAEISLAALKAGHKVVATARNVAQAQQEYPGIEQKGGQWLKLDVTSKETASIVEKAVKENDINVIVNNAGYALRGVLEDLRYLHPSIQVPHPVLMFP
jgi:short-subunit dehydrogenase